jgi:predicted HTH transcriptional regulator
MPRNKELMRVFRDLDMVEQLGLGVPRILKSYGRECFTFTENFLRMSFPAAKPLSEQIVESSLLPRQESQQESQQESRQELSLRVIEKLVAIPLSRQEISTALGEKKISGQLNKVISQLLADRLIEYTIPDKPNSRLQKYRLTAIGERLKRDL